MPRNATERTRARSKEETLILRDIERQLGSLPGVIIYRNNVGEAVYNTEAGKEYHVPYGLGPGTPDLIVIVYGRVLGLEVKSLEGKKRDNQISVQSQWRSQDARYEFVRSVEAARILIEAVSLEVQAEKRAMRELLMKSKD